MPYSTYLKNRLLNNLRNTSGAIANVYVSAHTTSPGDSGASEVSGGSPAYARKLVTFNAAAAGVLTTVASVTFDIPSGVTVAYVGFWDAATAGNFLGYGDPADEIFAAQGTYVVVAGTALDLNL